MSSIVDALASNDLEAARQALLEEILTETKGRGSWDNPHYSADKSLQQRIQLDLSADARFPYFGLENLRDRYLLRNKDGRLCEEPQTFLARVATGMARGDFDLAQELYNYMSRGWFLPATPVLMNIGTNKGLPISCFLNVMPDTLEGIFDTYRENAFLSKYGGGIGTDWSSLRGQNAPLEASGLKSSGVIPFLKIADSETIAISRNSTRRGAAAAYLRIDHPDIEDFLEIRKPTGGDIDRKCLNLNHGVTITDEFMQAVEAKAKFKLIDPHYKTVSKEVDALTLWRKILTLRTETGEPYLLFIDTVNKAVPQHHLDKGLLVRQSNLCCLSGETFVDTKEGPRRIEALVGQKATIWDGIRWVENDSFSQRGTDKLLRLHLGGSYVDCNLKHRWFRYRDSSEVLTSDLKIGDKLDGNPFSLEDCHPKWNEITKIEELPGEHPVYCPTVPSTGKFALANGLMTGNSEITLPTNEERTAVCCLAALNLETYEEWKDPQISDRLIYACVKALDNNLETFCEQANPVEFKKAIHSARSERSIGLGVMGYHGYLMSRGIPFESVMARSLNRSIFKHINMAAKAASIRLVDERGTPPDGGTQRNSYVMSLQPTASTAFLCGGATPSVEPISGNSFVQKTLSGSFLVKNKYLEQLLQDKGLNTSEVWADITAKKGSVQHLDCLEAKEKKVFRTAYEMNMREIVEQAGDRQPYICQAQSINLFFQAPVSGKYLDTVHRLAWKLGLKSLYYLRSEAPASAGTGGRDVATEECAVCQ